MKAPYRTRPAAGANLPSGIPYIVGNEAAERFSYYGMRAILVVFMTRYLVDAGGAPDLMDDAEARFYYHLFAGAVYFFPLLGALVADIWLGKYRTILGLSLVYCAGHGVLAYDDTRAGLAVGLALIAASGLFVAGCGPSSKPQTPPDYPGALAAELVRAEIPQVRVEVRAVPGREPDMQGLDLLMRRLREQVDKPGGVILVQGPALPRSEDGVYTDGELRALAGPTLIEGGQTLVLRVFYLDGESERDRAQGEVYLGLAHTASSLVMFKDSLAKQGSPAALERVVLLHEAGHLLGLVGRGAPVQAAHEDPSNLNHCRIRGCVMQSKSAAWSPTTLGSRDDFCSYCKADLLALKRPR